MTEVVSPPDGWLLVKILGSIQMSVEPPTPHSRRQGQGTGTNLHYDHSKSKHVRFPCDFVHSLDNLWRGPGSGVFSGLCYGARSTNDRSELEICQTSVAAVIDENIGLAKGHR